MGFTAFAGEGGKALRTTKVALGVRTVVAWLCLWVTSAYAEPIILADTYGDPDVAVEAEAATILMRQALSREGRPLITGQALLAKGGALRGSLATFDPKQAPELFAATGSTYGVQSELARQGTGLRLTVHVIDARGVLTGANTVVSSSSDIGELVRSALGGIRESVGTANSLPTVTAPQLATYAQAEALLTHGKTAEAADRLANADPSIAIESTAARAIAQSVWTSPQLNDETRLDLVGRFGTPNDIQGLAKDDSPAARLARARAQFGLADLDAAQRELTNVPASTPGYWAVEAELAHLRGDAARRSKAIEKVLAAPTPAGIAFLASLPSKTLTPDQEQQALRAARSLGVDALHLSTKIAVRDAASGIEPTGSLALISLRDLRPGDLGQLKSVIETSARAGDAGSLRLQAEIKLAGGDIDGAAKDVAAARAAGANDARLWRIQARVYEAQTNFRAAADAYGNAGMPHDQAQALRAAGDNAGALKVLQGASEPSLLAIALRAEAAATPADAAAILAESATLYPLNIELNRELSAALTSAGRPQEASSSASLVGKMESFMPSLKEERTANVAATSQQLGQDAAGPQLTTDPVLSQLRELLAATGAATFAGKRIALGWLTPDSFFAFTVLDRASVATAINKALASPPFEIATRVGDDTFTKSGLIASDLRAFAKRMSCDGVLLVGAAPAGDGMRVEAFVFDPGSTHSNGVAATIREVNWMRLNGHLLSAIAALILAVLGVVAFLIWRGFGMIDVRIKTDPAGTNEAFRVVVSPNAARPSIGDPSAFRAAAKRAGHKRSGKTVELAGPSSVFRVVPGTWYVHVLGVYDRGDELRELDETYSRPVTIKRGSHETISIDLAPTLADVRFYITDSQAPIVKLWIEGREPETTVITNRQGEALLKLPIGAFTLVIDGNGTKLTRPISVPSLTIHKVHINLERERKLAQVSGGLTLERQAVNTQFGDGLAKGTGGAPQAPQPPIGLAHAMPTGGATATPPFEAQLAAAPVRLNQAASPDLQTAHLAAAPTMTHGIKIGQVAPGLGETTGFGATGFAHGTVGAQAEEEAASLPGINTMTNLLLGRYQIIAELGRGAMGLVFHAWDANLERPVAIKVLSPELREHPQAMAFFVQEAKSLAQLNHSNIVSVYDQTSQGSQTLLIMEYVDGTTLEGILKQLRPLPPERALAIVEQLCNGLAYAHGKRIIHRDIKPANIFVSRDGVIKLGDFGLARVVNEIAIRKTEVRGTPLYMASEQVLGTDIDHRADLYAVGCTLFELLTGQPPFTEGAVMYHHVHTPAPAPSSLVPELGPELDALVLRCLAKSAEDRVPTATQLIEEIHSVLRHYA